jgi:hypothetical protein
MPLSLLNIIPACPDSPNAFILPDQDFWLGLHSFMQRLIPGYKVTAPSAAFK